MAAPVFLNYGHLRPCTWTTEGSKGIPGLPTSQREWLTSSTWADLADEITRQRHLAPWTPTAYLANCPIKKRHSTWKPPSHQWWGPDSFHQASGPGRLDYMPEALRYQDTHHTLGEPSALEEASYST